MIDDIDTKKVWALSDQERLKEFAEEIKVGNEKLYKENKSEIEGRHEDLKAAQD